tara:strand:+ start:9508 stop:9813 length:306 start_codon:yes stop_codon:yes gene_type:complete
MSEDKATATAAPADKPAEETAAQAPVALSLNDLGVLANIIDLASSRGAFRGAELTQVGAAYEKLTAFVRGVQESQAKAAGDESKAKEAPATDAPATDAQAS